MLKTGKLAPVHGPKQLRFGDFIKSKDDLVAAPVGFSHSKLVSEWGMLGNDQLGDCYWAGSDHETMLWTAIAGNQAQFTPPQTISDYAAGAGYDPNDPSTDRGTVCTQGYDYRRNVGVVDLAGNRHKIGSYVLLERGNWDQLLQSMYTFDVTGVGIEFPAIAMQQFQNGEPWDVVEDDGGVDGGHYIVAVEHLSDDTIGVVTWGKIQVMTRAFYEKYNDESYGIESLESLINGKTAEGFDYAALQSAIAAL